MQYPQAIYLPVRFTDNSADMDKYERRRLRLRQLVEQQCANKISEMARRIERDPSYVSRMLFAEGKAGKKRIADDMIEVIERAFALPHGWLDMPREATVAGVHHHVSEPVPPYHAWPFPTVTKERLDELKRRLGERRSEEALREIDAYLSIMLEKWERGAPRDAP